MKRRTAFNKLRFKITFGILLILSLCLLPLGYITITGQRALLLENLRSQGDRLALLVARTSAAHMEKFAFYRLEELSADLERHGQVAFCKILDNQGVPLIPAGKRVRPGDGKGRPGMGDERLLVVEKPIESRGETLGKVRIGMYLDPVYRQIRQKTAEAVAVFVIALAVVAGVMNLFLTRLFISPVIRLARTTRTLADGLFVTTDLSARPDEIGDLAEAFNQMSANLRQLYENLEDKVRERTRDLEFANRKLQKEMDDRIELEIKLSRARKMEAIGTLAGGVAHDLNNILSGLVSYPELILLELPEDSPLRRPIDTIRKSGEKAARIVEDLLTLSRRAVTTTEVIRLNDIILEYLSSPEHEKIRAWHPDVRVETDLAHDLMNVLGSPVHLSKTVMNLVVNAAEAMPDGGMIQIRTENVYVDLPISGFDRVAEGDFVLLSVTDTGVGISKEDMDRIFEPFYTKKVMGRSGTGLGMAVVWGTVKDHDGYIDIRSEPGKGAAIHIYLPVTRRPAASVDAETSATLDTLMGGNERILVVDDVSEQREIAAGILEKLGYRVTVSESGEKALEHLAVHRADLLLLDMIMDPGMDGLATYEKALALHPGIRAVIASGYSETERVKKALALGAGGYIRKPYTVETLGLAVQGALRRDDPGPEPDAGRPPGAA